jgi:hypothetical protein
MAFGNGPRIVTDGLVLSLDASDKNSYPGSGTAWRDLVGNSSATLVNSPTFTNNGGGIVFDGVDDYCDIPFSYDMYNGGVTRPFTMEVWVKHAYRELVSGETFAGAYGSNRFIGVVLGHIYRLGTTQIRICFLYGSIGGSEHNAYISQDQKWHQIVISVNSSNLSKIYVDSILQGTRTVTVATTAIFTDIRLAKDRGGACLPITFGSLKTYNRELESSEISQNYSTQKSRFTV